MRGRKVRSASSRSSASPTSTAVSPVSCANGRRVRSSASTTGSSSAASRDGPTSVASGRSPSHDAANAASASRGVRAVSSGPPGVGPTRRVGHARSVGPARRTPEPAAPPEPAATARDHRTARTHRTTRAHRAGHARDVGRGRRADRISREHREVQRALAGEVRVDRAARQPGPRGDDVDLRVAEAPLHELGARRGEHGRPVPLLHLRSGARHIQMITTSGDTMHRPRRPRGLRRPARRLPPRAGRPRRSSRSPRRACACTRSPGTAKPARC